MLQNTPIPHTRGVTPTASTVLIIVTTLILAGGVSGLIIVTTGNINQPTPTVGETALSFNSSNSPTQIVKIRHITGETVQMKNVEIRVSAPDCNAHARLHNLPAGKQTKHTLPDKNIAGDPLISDGTTANYQGPIYAADADHSWNSGEVISFRINPSTCNFEKQGVSALAITFIHTPSNSIFVEKEIP
jgi:FlaG/FlaF family flagellin (archaellin)